MRKGLTVCVSVIAAVAVAAGSFGAGYYVRQRKPAELPSVNAPNTDRSVAKPISFEPLTKAPQTIGAILQAFHLPKVPMIHNGSLGFSWTAERVFGARISDYLAPQLQEIFETIGIDTIGEFVIEDDVAHDTIGPFLRCYNIIDRQNGDGIAVLCSVQENREQKKAYLDLQVINPTLIVFPSKHDGSNCFGTADFDGDGNDEIVAVSWDIGADHERATLGIFPYARDAENAEKDAWGTPLFWAVDGGNEPLMISPWGVPYHFGFSMEQNSDKSWTLRNSITGYSRTVSDDTYYGSSSIDGEHITCVQLVDIEADGTFEIFVQQDIWHCPGFVLSLLKYDTKKKRFKTLYAEYILFEDDESSEHEIAHFQAVLTRAGYDAKKAVFKDAC